MKEIFEGLEKLLNDPKTSEETKELVKKLLQDEKANQERLANNLDRIIRGEK